MRTDVTEYLEKRGIQFRLKPHRNPVFTSEQAARERGIRLSQVAKTMVAQDASGNLYVAIVPGDRSLRLDKLRRAAGNPEIGLVPVAELQERFGLTVGAISPTQFIALGARFYMDESVLAEEWIDISSGRPEAGVELAARDLGELLDAQVCAIASGGKRHSEHGARVEYENTV